MTHNQEVLSLVSGAVAFINGTNSSKEKQERLQSILDSMTPEQRYWLSYILEQTYSPYVTFGVTSASVKKFGQANGTNLSIEVLLENLATRKITGYTALATINAVLRDLSDDLKDVVYNILDKNLKIRMDTSSINKVFPELIPIFEVSLCNVYAERKHKVDFKKDQWFASRKLDGCRCITIIDGDGKVKFFSRQGKEFTTLSVIEEQLAGGRFGRNIVLDGEMCIVDENGNEDFKSITKEITRKDHTIINPRYKVFDIMTLEEFEHQSSDRTFEERYETLANWVSGYNQVYKTFDTRYINLVQMTLVTDEKHFNELFDYAESQNWEGLVIRKNDKVICKRSDSMLKVKNFVDAEYIVEGTENGPFRVIKDGREVEEEVMTNAYITHKGTKVSVGSGWSLEQRRRYKEHPEELIGKTITVQYFEETTDKNGNISLRFPTCKMVYENGRNI